MARPSSHRRLLELGLELGLEPEPEPEPEPETGSGAEHVLVQMDWLDMVEEGAGWSSRGSGEIGLSSPGGEGEGLKPSNPNFEEAVDRRRTVARG